MDLRQNYLDAAEYIRSHGFSFELEDAKGGCCFIGALAHVCSSSEADAAKEGPLLTIVQKGGYSYFNLCRFGWTRDDAIAALEIAADLAAP